MGQSKFHVVYMGGRWYVVHSRTRTIVPASPKRTWHDTESSARSAAR